jgi:hypothetical protein
MSEARDKFFELLQPEIESTGYVFKKSKKQFIEIEGEAACTIDFSWDGRGGTTYLNYISGEISFKYIADALWTITGLKSYPIYLQGVSGGYLDGSICQMFSKELLKLANNMNFKEMSKMSFEEKYPIGNIQRTVNWAKNFIYKEIIPNQNEMAFEQKLLDFKIDNLSAKLKEIDTHNVMCDVLIIKIICKKMKIDEPKFIKDIEIFTNQSIDDLWNMQSYEFDKMEEKFNNLKF